MHGQHVKQSELVLVEQSWSWKRIREKVYIWGWGAGMETLMSLFTGCEAESGQAAEQLGFRIAGLNPQAGSRITHVVSGHPTGDDTVEGLRVASNTP